MNGRSIAVLGFATMVLIVRMLGPVEAQYSLPNGTYECENTPVTVTVTIISDTEYIYAENSQEMGRGTYAYDPSSEYSVNWLTGPLRGYGGNFMLNKIDVIGNKTVSCFHWVSHDKPAKAQDEDPPLGEYQCLIPPGGLPSGAITLISDTEYTTQLGNGGTGEFRYYRDTRIFEWLSGPLAEGFTASYTGLNSTGYTIELIENIGGMPMKLWCYH
jgi:hypothetical protein